MREDLCFSRSPGDRLTDLLSVPLSISSIISLKCMELRYVAQLALVRIGEVCGTASSSTQKRQEVRWSIL